MSKHTPGPWRVVRDERDEEPHDPIEIFAGKHCVAAAVADGDHYDTYADDELFLPVVEANAKLIAAAPDLLEALIRCLNWEDSDESWTDVMTAAAAAVAKAGVHQ